MTNTAREFSTFCFQIKKWQTIQIFFTKKWIPSSLLQSSQKPGQKVNIKHRTPPKFKEAKEGPINRRQLMLPHLQ